MQLQAMQVRLQHTLGSEKSNYGSHHLLELGAVNKCLHYYTMKSLAVNIFAVYMIQKIVPFLYPFSAFV